LTRVAVSASDAPLRRGKAVEGEGLDTTTKDSSLQDSPAAGAPSQPKRTGSIETRPLKHVDSVVQSKALGNEAMGIKVSEKRALSKPNSLAGRPGKVSAKHLPKNWPGSPLDTSSHTHDEKYADDFMFELPTRSEEDKVVAFQTVQTVLSGPTGKSVPQPSIPHEPANGNYDTRGNRKLGKFDPGEVQEAVTGEARCSDGQPSHSSIGRGEVYESSVKDKDDGSAVTLIKTSGSGSERDLADDSTMSAISVWMRKKGPRFWDNDFNEEMASNDTHQGDDPPQNDDTTRRTTARESAMVAISETNVNSMTSLSRVPTMKKPTSHRCIAPRKKDIPAYSVGHKLDRSTSVTRHASVSTVSRTEPDEVQSVQVANSFPVEQAQSRTLAHTTNAIPSPKKAGTLRTAGGVFDNPHSDQAIPSTSEQNSSVTSVRLETIVSDGEDQHSLFLDNSGHSYSSRNSNVHQHKDKDALASVGGPTKETNASGDYSKALVKKKHSLTPSGDYSNTLI
jgi:hypothetical protein